MISKLPWLPNFHRKSLITLFFTYIVLVSVVTLAVVSVYALLLPGTLSDGVALLKRAISASFSLSGYKEAAPSPFQDNPGIVVMAILFAHAFSILVLNMIFQAVITAKLIKPVIDLRLSDSAVFHPSYGLKQTPHILFRLVNASPFDLHLLSLKAFLTVHDEHPEDDSRSMTYYFPVPNIDPVEVPVLRSLNPWIIAISVDEALGNSIVRDYKWRLTGASGSQPGRRQLEVLVSGNETEASTSFMRAFTFNLETDGPNGLLCGTFQPLPSVMKKRDVGAINTRIPKPGAACIGCPEADCRFQSPQPASGGSV
jgi:hypothetical protein